MNKPKFCLTDVVPAVYPLIICKLRFCFVLFMWSILSFSSDIAKIIYSET